MAMRTPFGALAQARVPMIAKPPLPTGAPTTAIAPARLATKFRFVGDVRHTHKRTGACVFLWVLLLCVSRFLMTRTLQVAFSQAIASMDTAAD